MCQGFYTYSVLSHTSFVTLKFLFMNTGIVSVKNHTLYTNTLTYTHNAFVLEIFCVYFKQFERTREHSCVQPSSCTSPLVLLRCILASSLSTWIPPVAGLRGKKGDARIHCERVLSIAGILAGL